MFKIAAQLALLAMLVLPAHAEGWQVSRVRGTAEQLSGGMWVQLERGSSIEDGQRVRTGADGRVGLSRGAETVELEPGTQIRLHEGVGSLTSIEQASGLLSVDVERRNVQHFSVQTPFLAAVVKGTRFSVAVGQDGSHVTVDRGVVQVQDTINDLVVDVSRGQEAEVSKSEPLTVTGGGSVAVFTFDGQRVVNGTADTPADNSGRAASTTVSEKANATSQSDQTPGNGDRNGKASSSSTSSSSSGNSSQGNSSVSGNSNGNSGNGNDGRGNGQDGSGNGGGNGNGNGGGNGNGNSGGNNGNGNGNSNSGDGGSGNGNGKGNSGHGSDVDSSGNNGNGDGNNGNGNGNGRSGKND